MKSLKIISLLLAALLCLPLLAACAESGGNTSGTRPPNGGSEDVGNFVEADYKGEKFTFLHIRQFSQGKDYYGGKFLDAETVDGKTVEDAVWERNSAVEARFNVVVDEKIIDDQDPANYLQEVAFADTYDYDVIYGWGVKMGACIPSGYFTDLSVLPNIDLEQEYWSPSATEDLSINGK
ncbi:MAG: hypothetical protein IJD22_04450, partial [Clostridia bacterium]|nr:hypothetical protein [Clostridia bacterium]